MDKRIQGIKDHLDEVMSENNQLEIISVSGVKQIYMAMLCDDVRYLLDKIVQMGLEE